MDEQLHNIDYLFQDAVERHSELPTDNVWLHLEKTLQKRNVSSITKKYKKWRWVAAALFIFSVALAIYTIQLTWKYKKNFKEKKFGTFNLNYNKNSSDKIQSSNQPPQKSPYNSVRGETENQNELAEKRKESTLLDIHNNAAATNSLNPKAKNSTNKNKLPTTPPGLSILHATDVKANKENNGSLDRSLSGNMQEDNKTRPANGLSSLSLQAASSTAANAAGIPPQNNNLILKASSIQESGRLLITQPVIAPTPGITYSTLLNSSATKKNIRLKLKSLHPEKFTAGIFYSGQMVSTDLKANHPDFREDNYLQIKTHETNRISTTIGLTLSRKIIGNLSVASGISLATYITDISRKPLVARRDNNGRISYRISTSSGYAYYSVKARPQPALADSIQTLSSKSTVKYISVPLGMKYNFYLGRFSFTPAVLVYANLKSTAKIRTIQSLEHTYTGDIEGLKSAYFDANMGLGVGYFVKKKILISVIPAARIPLSAATGKNPVTSQHRSVGLTAGLDFVF